MPLPLSLIILARNEERNLPRLLASAADLASEILVVDSGSTDRTREIAVAAGARVISQDWLGMAQQRRFGLAQAAQPWALCLDCDEELSPELGQSIGEFFSRAELETTVGASCARKTWFLGRWITHGDWYPDRQLRLVRRVAATVSGRGGHDKIEVAGPVARLAGDLHHYSFADMADYLRKMNRFSDEHAAEARARGKRWSLAAAVTRPWWRFFRAYVLRRGFLDGFPGFWIAAATAFYTFVRHSRLYESGERS
ncbi:MAG: glycosyltransferase family 2 protein [Chthoniobacterales bacterium]